MDGAKVAPGSCTRAERMIITSSFAEGSKKQLVDDAALRVGDWDKRKVDPGLADASGMEGCFMWEEQDCNESVFAVSAWIAREEYEKAEESKLSFKLNRFLGGAF